MDQRLGTYKEAYQLLSDPFACLKALTITRHINLLPKYMSQLRTGIRHELDQELNLFSDELGGVLIAYDNMQRLQSGARIFEEQPYLHLDIKVDIIIFQPQVGSKLWGEVNKINYETSVGCLVHNCFNASVFKPRNMDTDAWEGSKLCIGDRFQLEVVKIFSNNRVLSMKGAIQQGSLMNITKSPAKIQLTGEEGEAVTPQKEKKAKKTRKKSKEMKDEHKKESKKRKANFDDEDNSESFLPPPKKRKHRKTSESVVESSAKFSSTTPMPGPSGFESPLARQKLINEQSLSLIASIGALGKVPGKKFFSAISPTASDSGVSSLVSNMEETGPHLSKKRRKKSKEKSDGEHGEPTRFLSQDSELSRVISSEDTSRGSQDIMGGDLNSSRAFSDLASDLLHVQPSGSSSLELHGHCVDTTGSAKKHKKKKSKSKDVKSKDCKLTSSESKHSHKHKKEART